MSRILEELAFAFSLAMVTVACATSQNSQGLGASVAEEECNPANWQINITKVDQQEQGDGIKLVILSIGIENNDSFWGSMTGPSTLEDPIPVSLSTTDGSSYTAIRSAIYLPASDTYLDTGWIGTALLPPGFAALGQTFKGQPYDFNFAFEIPDVQTPDTVTIGGLEVGCILTPIPGTNGHLTYHGGSIDLPARTYKLISDVEDVHGEPTIGKFPYIVGSTLELRDREGTIEFTGVTRQGNSVNVVFDYTNALSSEASPQFTGYVIGDDRYYSCQTSFESDCENESMYMPVQAGQTAQGLIWTFTVPKDETNLMLVYVYGDVVDVNKVYRLSP